MILLIAEFIAICVLWFGWYFLAVFLSSFAVAHPEFFLKISQNIQWIVLIVPIVLWFVYRVFYVHKHPGHFREFILHDFVFFFLPLVLVCFMVKYSLLN